MLPTTIYTFNGALLPDVTAQRNIGSATKRWGNIFAAGVSPAGDLIPAADNTYDIGTLTGPFRWRSLYTIGAGQLAGHDFGSTAGGITSLFLGKNAFASAGGASIESVAIGTDAGQSIASPQYATYVGKGAGANAAGINHTMIGNSAGFGANGNSTTALGAFSAGILGANSLALGYAAGNQSAGASLFFLDAISRGSAPAELTDSMMVGAFGALGANTLRLNASVTLGRAASAFQTVIDGTAYGAGVASLRLNGLTTGAAAGAGTLTNAPTAGDPVFWIPISIAGVVRYIPAWP